MAEHTIDDYRAALNAAMLYAQSITEDGFMRLPEPSERTRGFILELATTHSDIIQSVTAELNNPPR